MPLTPDQTRAAAERAASIMTCYVIAGCESDDVMVREARLLLAEALVDGTLAQTTELVCAELAGMVQAYATLCGDDQPVDLWRRLRIVHAETPFPGEPDGS